MDTVLECLMLASFCGAIAYQLYGFLGNRRGAEKLDRVFFIGCGIGFLLGAIRKELTAPNSWVIVIYALGAMLSYTTALASFPDLGTQD